MNIEGLQEGRQSKESLVLSGDMTLGRIVEAREAILAALQSAGEVVVEAANVTAADLSVLQLFCSARKTARSLGKKLIIRNVSEAIIEAASECGFLLNEPSPNAWDTEYLRAEGGR